MHARLLLYSHSVMGVSYGLGIIAFNRMLGGDKFRVSQRLINIYNSSIDLNLFTRLKLLISYSYTVLYFLLSGLCGFWQLVVLKNISCVCIPSATAYRIDISSHILHPQ